MNKFLILLSSLFALTFFGCNNDEEELDLIDTLENEKIAIHEYLSQITTPILYLEYYSVHGMLIDTVFIFNYDNSGEVAKDSGWVLMDYEKFYLNGGKLDMTSPEQGDSTFTYAFGGPVLYRYDTIKKYDYVAEAFRHISVGSMGGEMIVPSILAGDKNNYGKPLHYKLKAHKLINDVKVNEYGLIRSYLVDIMGVENAFVDFPTREISSIGERDTVTYTAILEKGTGDRDIQVGDSVLLEMDYGLLDDVGLQNRVLRSMGRDSIYFLFNETWQKNYPTGLVKGLQHLQAGDSAHIIVPYGMAYGAVGTTREITFRDRTKLKQYLIPPYSTLWYWVRIRKVVPPKTEEE